VVLVWEVVVEESLVFSKWFIFLGCEGIFIPLGRLPLPPLGVGFCWFGLFFFRGVVFFFFALFVWGGDYCCFLFCGFWWC